MVRSLHRLISFHNLPGIIQFFLGTMAILTALQQACVSRLKKTFHVIAATTIDKLNEIKSMLSGSKNFLTYRENLLELIQHLDASHQINSSWREHILRKASPSYSSSTWLHDFPESMRNPPFRPRYSRATL